MAVLNILNLWTPDLGLPKIFLNVLNGQKFIYNLKIF